jgi:hypothetical protein
MKPLFQNDPRWKDTKIGMQEQLTIEQVGCLLTCLTMTVNYYGGSETPASLNEKMKAVQGFSGAWIKSAMVPAAFPELGFQRQMHEDSPPVSLDLVDKGLADDSLVLVCVDWTPDANIDSHWVVVHGRQGDDYQIWDPWQKTGAADTLVGRYGFGGKQAADIILEAIWYGKKDFDKTAVSQPAPAAKPAKKTRASKKTKTGKETAGAPQLTVHSTTSSLSLRRKPIVNNETLIRYVRQDEILQVVDGDNPLAKIGVKGQWLHVRTDGGTEGYVAAWFVERV